MSGNVQELTFFMKVRHMSIGFAATGSVPQLSGPSMTSWRIKYQLPRNLGQIELFTDYLWSLNINVSNIF